MKRLLALMLALALALPGCAARSRPLMSVAFVASSPQSAANDATTIEAWRNFVAKLPPGVRLHITMKDGRRLRATLMQATADAIVVNPVTRIPEPVQTIALANIASLDVESEGRSVGQSVGIGVAAGAGAFLTILLILIASIDD